MNSAAWRSAIIERIEDRTPRVKSFFLRVDGIEPHVAGQHVDLRLTAEDGYTAQRSYSIASSPMTPLVELAVERLPDGEVSAFLHDVAIVGDEIELRGPIGGHFVWRPGDGGPLLLIGGGSGVAPLMSILRIADVPSLLIYSARNWDDVIFRPELSERTDVVFTLTRDMPRRDGDFGARLDRAMLQGMIERWGLEPLHVYVCGATAFVEVVTSALVSLGVPAARIKAERYGGVTV